ncbi:uncharacterized protein LOC127446407 [Myxocyprinus asiaticus]|uniref:uncharacterized protein LOC127446407 n=1 Tax=Myxocyprinus asiaticus TaxID=70543 RepID=UPI00222299D8|nr:uncharacterized protein LOC127446407 [Myxocyprinus asiaticus]
MESLDWDGENTGTASQLQQKGHKAYGFSYTATQMICSSTCRSSLPLRDIGLDEGVSTLAKLAKTELLVIPAKPSVDHNLTINLGSTTLTPTRTTQNLGVVVDDQIYFTAQISSTACPCLIGFGLSRFLMCLRLCLLCGRAETTSQIKKRSQTIKGIWILSLAINCDWTSEYTFQGKCCKTCPLGEYPKEHCKENNSDSVCERCSTKFKDKCFCEGKILCNDDECSKCVPKEKCKPGHQLMREGNFKYEYHCEPCPNTMFNDAEDSKCKPFAKCDGLRVIFPGNSTHNARCGLDDKGEISSPNFNPVVMASLTITVLICLVLIMHTAFQTYKHRRHRKISQACTHRMGLPSDTCSCQLSKEEIGDDSDSKTASEISQV